MRNRRFTMVVGVVTLLVTASTAAFAADPVTVRFRHLGREDGLSQAYVNAIAQDRHGFLWFGTNEGLNRYDGYRFRLYANDPDDSNSIGADLIRSLATDDTGTLWVGTDGGGAARYDADTDQFTRYRHDPSREDSLSSDQVRTLAVAADGGVWIGVDDAGLNRLEPATGRVRRFSLDDGPLDVYAIDFDAEDRPIVGTSRGLFRFDQSQSAFEPMAVLDVGDALVVRALWVDDDGTVWVGSATNGLIRLGADGTQTQFAPEQTDGPGLSHATVKSIRRVGDGDLWVGTEDGLNLISADLETVTAYRKSPGQEFGLRDSYVQALFEDEAGLLWVGTFNGVSYWDTLTAAMKRYSAKPGIADELPTNNINSFIEDTFGRIWVATRDHAVVVFDPEQQRFTPLVDLLGIDPLPTQFATTLTADRDGDVWIGSRRSGLMRVSPRDRSVSVYQNSDAPGSISGNGISAILEDSAGQIWAAAFNSGLNRFEPGGERFVRWVHEPDNPESISSNRILTLHEGRNGMLWLGHWRAGVDRLNTRTGRIDRISVDTPLEGSLVQFLGEDAEGNLWIGTAADGLFRWSADAQAANDRFFERFTEINGLPSSNIYSGVFDQRGYLWLGTGNGLSRFDVATLEFENYDTSHGLLNNEFTFGAAYAALNGTLYFGGDSGFNAFKPEEIRGNPHPPRLAITAVRKLNEPMSVAPLVAGRERFELTHKDYLLEFEVAGLDFAAPEKNRYRFRLDGLDEDWLNVGDKRSITYTNLEPGDYTFRAQASNNYGVWSTTEARLAFRVLPAPWATWWAYAAYLLAAFALLAIIYRANAARLREQAAARHAAELATMNTDLTREVDARREKERALQREKYRAETYFNVAEVVLLTIDKDMRIVRINDKGQELLGYTAKELIGRSWGDFIPEPQRDDARTRVMWRLTNPSAEPPGFVELPMVSSTGEERQFVWKCSMLEFDNEESALLLSGMDVTRMRALEKQMRLREKMNAIGTLAGGIAHDFNNILQAIYGFTTLALDNLPANDEKSAYLKQVVKGADRARNLVKRILTFSNQKEYDLKAVDVGPVISEACALLRGSLPATVEIAVDVTDERQPVRADPTRIHQIVMNLGTNAAQSMEEGGGRLRVGLEHEIVREARQSGLSKLRPGSYMVIRVSDTGIGMTADTQEHIFDPFFTTKDTSENTGLGLTVVHGIVQSHGGEVFVESRPGVGTEFTVYLPSANQGIEDERVTELSAWRGTESILLVDDEDWVLTVTRKILEGQGYRVVSVASGAEALRHVERHAARIDILITDETMPKMTGSQLINAVHEIRADLPAIIISGKLAPAAVNDANTWFLQKPFTAPEINEKVRYVLDEVRGEERRA
ncbi:MAG: two-component regulator propeller domain-containing protein [Pseudomonadota bacterium]